MPPRVKLVFLAMCVSLFAIAAVPLYKELTRPDNIWWTPQAMLVPLPESKDRVRVYVRGGPLDSLIETGRLRIVEDGGSSAIGTSDIGFRFNNWDRVRGDRVPRLLIYAASCGVLALMFVLILTGRIPYRPET